MQTPEKTTKAAHSYDVVIIGAGFGGMTMLRQVRDMGLSSVVLEAGEDVGGTWYWNRYPGARTDSEAWYYCYSFSPELLESWNWSERYPSQGEMLRYLEHVADRFDLRRDIRFNTKVNSARFMGDTNSWEVETDAGEKFAAKFLVTAVGILSAPFVPNFKGVESFKGEWYQTARWPEQEPDLRGKRVGLIGTGATGVQVTPVIAPDVGHLTIFQRTPNFVLPAHNHQIDDELRRKIKDNYSTVWQKVRDHPFAMPFQSTGKLISETSEEEIRRILDEGWRRGGFRFLFETFDDIIITPEANEVAAEYIRNKIRETVKDPKTAELLCPKDHPYGSKRPPAGHGYYETFNRDNVSLVDVSDGNSIVEITPTGIRTQQGDYELDVIIFATGFDAFTGSYTAIDIHGEDGSTLRDKWKGGARAYLGLAANGFPNMFMVNGPLTPFANNPPIIEKTAGWVADMLAFAQKTKAEKIEVSAQAESEWVQEIIRAANETIVPLGGKANSWLSGQNIPGKVDMVMPYLGGFKLFSERCDAEAGSAYPSFSIETKSDTGSSQAAETLA